MCHLSIHKKVGRNLCDAIHEKDGHRRSMIVVGGAKRHGVLRHGAGPWWMRIKIIGVSTLFNSNFSKSTGCLSRF